MRICFFLAMLSSWKEFKKARERDKQIEKIAGREFYFGYSWGRFLYSGSIAIRYRLFYWSCRLCPMSRADPRFFIVEKFYWPSRALMGSKSKSGSSQHRTNSKGSPERSIGSPRKYYIVGLKIHNLPHVQVSSVILQRSYLTCNF